MYFAACDLSMSAVCYELVSIKIRQAVKNYVTEVSQIATLQHKKSLT